MADNQIERIQRGIYPPPTGPAAPRANAPSQGSFTDALQQQLRLSAHAQTRLVSRKIDIGPEQWQRVNDGVQKAASKGARESLVLLDDVALVISIRNRTVITAVDKEQLKDNVFTHIDSAVIV